MTADIDHTGAGTPPGATDRPTGPWHDTTLTPEARADALIAAMTLQEKTAQLFGVWVGASDEEAKSPRSSTTWRRPSTSTRCFRTASAN